MVVAIIQLQTNPRIILEVKYGYFLLPDTFAKTSSFIL